MKLCLNVDKTRWYF